MSLITRWSAQRATMPMPPKQPLAPPISTTVGMPAARRSSSARITSLTAISPALASCRRTPPDSAIRITASGRSLDGSCSARLNRPTSLAPWTSPTPPPMNSPSCAATKTRWPSSSARPIATPSSKAAGTPSCARCGLIARAEGGSHSWKLPASNSRAIRSRAEHSA